MVEKVIYDMDGAFIDPVLTLGRRGAFSNILVRFLANNI